MNQILKTYRLWIDVFDTFDSTYNGFYVICYIKKCNTIVLSCNHFFGFLLCGSLIKYNKKNAISYYIFFCSIKNKYLE